MGHEFKRLNFQDFEIKLKDTVFKSPFHGVGLRLISDEELEATKRIREYVFLIPQWETARYPEYDVILFSSVDKETNIMRDPNTDAVRLVLRKKGMPNKYWRIGKRYRLEKVFEKIVISLREANFRIKRKIGRLGLNKRFKGPGPPRLRGKKEVLRVQRT